MSSMVRRTIAIAVVAIALLAGAIWLIASLRDDGGEEDTSGRGAAVMPSDGGGTDPDQHEGTTEDHRAQHGASPASEGSEQPAIPGDFTGPAQAALAFATTYPDDVGDSSDPTVLASLDGVEISLLSEVTDPQIEHVDEENS